MKPKELRRLLSHLIKVNNQQLCAPGQKKLTELQVKVHYLKILSELPTFGGRCFNVVIPVSFLDTSMPAHILALVHCKFTTFFIFFGRCVILSIRSKCIRYLCVPIGNQKRRTYLDLTQIRRLPNQRHQERLGKRRKTPSPNRTAAFGRIDFSLHFLNFLPL